MFYLVGMEDTDSFMLKVNNVFGLRYSRGVQHISSSISQLRHDSLILLTRNIAAYTETGRIHKEKFDAAGLTHSFHTIEISISPSFSSSHFWRPMPRRLKSYPNRMVPGHPVHLPPV